ncbi:MAG: DUF134 domain-containing protein [Candidatus Methanospirare jalkutatii]|nr:DUF134 domain-containing protein [Candidatus Methanospirare jalkutatii]
MRRRRRCVGFLPHFFYFEPRVPIPGYGDSEGEGRSENERIRGSEEVLKVEELESIRLKDLLGLTQEEAARRMGVSQPTFHRILQAARRKIASALVEGKALRIEGGDFVLVSSEEQGRDQATSNKTHAQFLNTPHHPQPPPPPPQPICWMPPCRGLGRRGSGRKGNLR